MKIGILTYHRSINYGAVMQSYALSRRLSELHNVDVEIIDYMSARMDRYYKLFTIYRGKDSIIKIKDRINMYKAFSRGFEKLALSENKLVSDSIDDFKKYINNRYDVIIVGSDAVWNYEKRGLPNPYFLTDVDNVKKISYAASCNGIKYENVNEEKLTILRNAWSDFSYIGVRDTLTETLVKRAVPQANVFHNCDPTLLLDFKKDGLDEALINQLKNKLEKQYNWDCGKKHIGLMLSNLNGGLAEKLVENIRKKYGDDYQIVSIYSYCKYADIPYISDLTPFEWSRIFSLFDITFSKYFHGTLLSILNGVPVISLSAEHEIKNIPAKVEDVLGRLDFMDFYCPAKSASDIDWDLLMSKVDMFINNPPKEKMKSGIEKERQSANSFFEYMKSIK